ncbi:type II toxin-antitoxin system RelE/ParE family toxin [Helicobacter sp. 23-1045]
MREIHFQNTYEKDFKLVKKQGWNLEKIKSVVIQLQTCDILEPQLKDHALLGTYSGYRECHIYGDLVIVYKRDKETLALYRIGRHQDLFKNY